ncbi:MAG: hypothetical protein PVF47_10710 [Anaerolineae bacterium]|jgi:hypothetical protein
MRVRLLIFAALLALLLAGCGSTVVPGGEEQVSPLATPAIETPLPPTQAATASPAPTPTPSPLALLVLHTNDNWGETEPCG